MLDLGRLQHLKLSARPLGQRVIARFVLYPNFYLPRRVKIRLEGAEKIPKEPVIFAMNHTDRYNYWPFQFELWRTMNRFTATWVKGKYYENAMMGRFMEWTNNLPTVSRGYIVTRDFINVVKRRPTDAEYEVLRERVDRAVRAATGEVVAAVESGAHSAEVTKVLAQARDMLGRAFKPEVEDYGEAVLGLFDAMMTRFLELHTEAFAKGLDLLIFPQGTRSIRLSKGHIGISQVALAYDRMIVPVGCSGSDKCYPGGNPLAKGGEIIYRVGEPITRQELARFRPAEAFVPFSPSAEVKHRDAFQGLVDVVMDRINDLVDEPYRYAEDRTSEGVSGSKRFV